MKINRCKRCGKNDIMCQGCRINYEKVKKSLNPGESIVLDELLIKHFNSDSCGCNYENEEDIHMCPIGMFEDGCREEDLIDMVKDIAKQRKEDME